MPTLVPTAFRFVDFELDLEANELTHRGHKVRLQEQPIRLLAVLVSRSGEIVTREELQSHLWPGNTFVEFDKSLRVAVSKLREALRDSTEKPIYIETITRRGYRFIAPVTVEYQHGPAVEPEEAAAPVPEPAIRIAKQAASGVPVSIPSAAKPKRGSRPLVWASAALLLLGVSLYVFRDEFHRASPAAVSARPVARVSIAVVGLRNLSGNADDRWLSTALTEMLSNELSSSDRVRVVSGEEVAHAGISEAPANTPSHETLVRYGNQLGADLIVFGSYTVSRDLSGSAPPRMRLDLRMENISNDAPPFALIETGHTTDLFILASASGSQLRRRLGLGDISADALSAVKRTLPADPTAAQFYAEGLERLRVFDPLHARDRLRDAIRIEPTHAGSHLALARAWKALGYDVQARSEATRAVELATGLPREELIEMQGEQALFSNDYPRAIEVFRSLFTFFPDNVDYGLRLAGAQDNATLYKDALASLHNIRQGGPSRADDARLDLIEALIDSQLGDFQKAIAAADRAVQTGTDLDQKLVRAQGLLRKAWALERLGKASDSLNAAQDSQASFLAAGDKQSVGAALLIKGDVLYDQSKFTEARQSFLAALDLFRETGVTGRASAALELIGNTYYSEGALAESRKSYQQAIDVLRGAGAVHQPDRSASLIGNLANVQDTEGDMAGALQSNLQGLALFEESGNKRGMSSTLDNMGNLEMERGGLDQAFADYSRAAEINRGIAYNRGLAHSLMGQGDVLLARDDVSGAVQHYEQALSAVKGMDEPTILESAHLSLGTALIFSGQVPQALDHLQQSTDLATKQGDHATATLCLTWLARAQLIQGRPGDALTSANRGLDESRGQFSPQVRIIAALEHARIQIAQGDKSSAQKELIFSEQNAKRYGYSPLLLESHILQARLEPLAASRHRQLSALTKDATDRGWKLLAAEARTSGK